MTPTLEHDASMDKGSFNARKLLVEKTSLARFLEARGGAAMVEFALAIMPVLILFFGMMQWSICAYVNLIVQHAAIVAARAEAVMRPGMPDNGGATGTGTDLEKAIAPLFVHVAGFESLLGLGNMTVKVTTQAKPCDQTMNVVQVTLYYPCTVPLGNKIACGGALSDASSAFGGPMLMKLTSTASFPNQGSYYESVWASKIGGGVSCSGS
jgi:hypothetical protein